MGKLRAPIAALTLSAAAFVGLLVEESFTSRAIIPTKNDRPTVGFGSTFKEDGSPVKMGDTITAPQAVARALNHIEKDEGRLKACVKMPVSQVEYDLLVNHSYQYGVARTCSSEMVTQINAGNYVASCVGYLRYKKSGGYDCSTPGNRICAGVWARSQHRYKTCMEAL